MHKSIIFCVFFLGFGGLEALHVQVFADVEFKGLKYEHQSDGIESCYDVKEYGRGIAGSLKTDTCLIIYEELGCNGYSYKLSRDMDLKNLRKNVVSFHPCTKSFGGNTIRVDMFSGSTLVGRYKDVCGCQDLPSQVTTQLTSFNNFGNCVTVYETSTCSLEGEFEEIPAGMNGQSEDLKSLGFYVRSISACGKRLSCVRLKADIFKIVFKDNPTMQRILKTGSKNVDLATKTKFFNNGSATVFQEYEARKMIRESTTVTLSQAVSKMAVSNVSESLKTETSYGPGFDIGIVKHTHKITDSVKESYKTETTDSEENRESHTHETENEFAVKQVIEVPACSEYEVSSTVEIVENVPLFYELYSKVTGESSGRRMTVEEISTQVDEMTFVEMIDEYTAVYKTVESLVANIGVDTKISGEGKPIQGCH